MSEPASNGFWPWRRLPFHLTAEIGSCQRAAPMTAHPLSGRRLCRCPFLSWVPCSPVLVTTENQNHCRHRGTFICCELQSHNCGLSLSLSVIGAGAGVSWYGEVGRRGEEAAQKSTKSRLLSV